MTTRRGTNTRFYPSTDAITGPGEDRRRFLESARISLGLPCLFYASLRSHRVFETVTGRAMDELRCERVAIRGYRLGIAEAGTGFPGIFPAPGNPAAEIECTLVHGLGRFEQTMVAWYEWDEYALHQITLSDGRRAQVFIPDAEAIRLEHGPFEIEPWSFEAWHAAGLDRAVANAREWMAQRPDDVELARAGFFTLQTPRREQRAAG